MNNGLVNIKIINLGSFIEKLNLEDFEVEEF